MYLLVAVELTSLAMRRLPRRLWRLVHLSSYLVFWAALIHGATAGSDSGDPAYLGAVTAGIAVVALLTGYRVVTIRRRASARRRRVPAAQVASES
jgi:DMSO/TMAO reductase YedYZ heme-binding membrane subunit